MFHNGIAILGFCNGNGTQKTRIVAVADGEKVLHYVQSFVLDSQTDRRADRICISVSRSAWHRMPTRDIQTKSTTKMRTLL